MWGDVGTGLGVRSEEVPLASSFPPTQQAFPTNLSPQPGNRDVGIGKDGVPKGSFARGTEIRARQTILTEGCRGSCSEEVMKKFGLRDHSNVSETFNGTISTKVEPQSYGIGVKEVWEIPEENCRPGFVQHTLGWCVPAC